ncbi:MAG: SRPBCC family protein [Pseudomonadota bacterium]
MAHVIVEKVVSATPADVWASWDDFGNIAKFNPNLAGSHLLADQATGVGATRQCDMKDGKNHIRERIVEYAPKQRMVVDIYEGTMPLKKAVATIVLSPAGSGRTRVQMKMEFQPKFGLLGALMVPMMKPQFRKMLQALLDGNATYVQSQVA